MKKLLLFCLFILSISPVFALFGAYAPIKADEIQSTGNDLITVTPALTDSQVKSHDTALYVSEYLRQGGSIDFSNISDSYGIGDFIDDFIDSLENLIDGNRYSSKQELTYKNSYNLTQLGLDSFMNVYMNNLGNLPVAQSPSANPDEDYLDYLAIINGSGFFWRNYSSTSDLYGNGQYVQRATRYPFYEYSFCAVSNGTLNASNVYILDPDGATAYFCLPITININGSGDTYQMQGSVTPYSTCCYNVWNGFYYDAMYFFRSPSQQAFNRDWDGRGYGINLDNLTYSYSGTLADCLSFIAQRFRNVNIIVNGSPWSVPLEDNNYVDLGRGTYIEGTNYPIEYQYPPNVDVYVDVDDLIDRIEDIIENKDVLTFDDIEDLIVDENGQEAVAVVVVGTDMDEDTIDDWYVKHYGSLIPIFPNAVTFPISVEKTASIVVTPLEGIPSDLKDVLLTLFLGTMMVCLLQRLLE